MEVIDEGIDVMGVVWFGVLFCVVSFEGVYVFF